MFKEEYKSYYVEGDGTFGMKVVKPKTGVLPKTLRGSFTDSKQAKSAIDSYVSKKGKTDGKETGNR